MKIFSRNGGKDFSAPDFANLMDQFIKERL